MNLATESAGNDTPEAFAGLVENATEEPSRRPGRPPGAKNKVSRSTLAALAEGGPAIARRMVRIALGRPVLGERDPATKQRKRLWPDLPQQQYAARLVLAKLVADLKFQELAGGLDNTNDVTFNGDEHSNRDLAKSVLSLLAKGVPGGHVAVTAPGEFTAHFSDGALGARILGNGSNGHANPENASAGTPESSGPIPGQSFPVADGKGRIEYFGLDDRSIPAWGVYGSHGYHARFPSRDLARAAAERMAAEGKL